MVSAKSKNPIVAKLEAAGAPRNMTLHAISIAAGLDRGFLQKLEERGPKASVRAASLAALAGAVGLKTEDLLAVAPHTGRAGQGSGPASPPMALDVPILGVAAGSVTGAFQISSDAIGYVARPPALAHVADAYAVYVNNESMVPLHNPGDLRFVHPHKPPRGGESVVLQVADGEETLAYIKIYERTAAGWVVCRQINPAAEVKFSTKQVRAVHRVLTMNELFNA